MAETTLKKLKYQGSDIQVESAIRDGNGNNIVDTYGTKSEILAGIPILELTENSGTLTDAQYALVNNLCVIKKGDNWYWKESESEYYIYYRNISHLDNTATTFSQSLIAISKTNKSYSTGSITRNFPHLYKHYLTTNLGVTIIISTRSTTLVNVLDNNLWSALEEAIKVNVNGTSTLINFSYTDKVNVRYFDGDTLTSGSFTSITADTITQLI